MTDESYSFTTAKTRLDEIVTQVRKKDTSLEKSLDLLEEGVRLANVCTELIDHADWTTTPTASEDGVSTAVAGEDKSEEMNLKKYKSSDDGAMIGSEGDEIRADSTERDSDPEPDGPAPADEVGDVWSEDEAWADEVGDDPSDGDDGHGV